MSCWRAGNEGRSWIGCCRFELERAENFGLERGWPIIESVASSLKGSPAESLSLADLVALGGAWAVRATGGPTINIPVGMPPAWPLLDS